jgi:hypothetical protein
MILVECSRASIETLRRRWQGSRVRISGVEERARSLARLRVRQDRKADATQILALVYGVFADGLPMADARKTKSAA